MTQPVISKTGKESAREAVRPKMKALAQLVFHLEPDETWAFVDALFPRMSEGDKEDLYDLIIFEQRKDENGGRPAEDVFEDIERNRNTAP